MGRRQFSDHDVGLQELQHLMARKRLEGRAARLERLRRDGRTLTVRSGFGCVSAGRC